MRTRNHNSQSTDSDQHSYCNNIISLETLIMSDRVVKILTPRDGVVIQKQAEQTNQKSRRQTQSTPFKARDNKPTGRSTTRGAKATYVQLIVNPGFEVLRCCEGARNNAFYIMHAPLRQHNWNAQHFTAMQMTSSFMYPRSQMIHTNALDCRNVLRISMVFNFLLLNSHIVLGPQNLGSRWKLNQMLVLGCMPATTLLSLKE